MDINAIRSAVTVLAFAAFVGLLVWAYLPARKQAFDEAAAMPLKDEESGS
jgi:cytochrome c oxidase cbb3-type subunit 4